MPVEKHQNTRNKTEKSSVSLCFLFRRKKEPKKNNNRRFQPLQSGNDSSKHSTLNGVDPRVDPRNAENRLPKVGSNGLWMGGTPSMYAGPPQANYHYGDRDRDRERDRHGKRSSSLQRTTSEERLHQSKLSCHVVFGHDMLISVSCIDLKN